MWVLDGKIRWDLMFPDEGRLRSEKDRGRYPVQESVRVEDGWEIKSPQKV